MTKALWICKLWMGEEGTGEQKDWSLVWYQLG